ncbi:MAG: hypothetical protein CL841_01625 [Crocinitomicaceae bacterium]|nr:hypothetical protein [Crocinitomicaceae bacterium]
MSKGNKPESQVPAQEPVQAPKAGYKPWGIEVNQFCTLMHVALLLVPILSIVMWATNKDDSDLVDEHGKNILNALISYLIWTIISCGFAAILFFIFIIIGIIKASDNVVYKYPLSIRFIK